MGEQLLEVKNLTIDFSRNGNKNRVVDSVSFSLEQGQTLGIVGESGSGKTVTSLALLRLLNAQSATVAGHISFLGKDLLSLSPTKMRAIRGKEISMIFQEPMTSLNPVFTIGSQVSEALIVHNSCKNSKEAAEKTVELLREVGIPDPEQRFSSYPHEMSGGQRQRVMIAMAIACRPKLLIADEPTTALDVTIQKQVLDLLEGLKQKYNMSMIFITHDLGLVADRTDKVCIMYQGKLVEQGDTAKIFHSPQHPYTKGLLNCRPHLHANRVRMPTLNDYVDASGKAKVFDIDQLKKKQLRDLKNAESVLQVKSLSKYYEKKSPLLKRNIGWNKACQNINFDLRRGEVIGLVGESGSGKSTLGKTLMMLTSPTSGKIVLLGNELTILSKNKMIEQRQHMQLIFQDPYSSLNPKRTILSAITEPMVVHGIGKNREERQHLAQELMSKVGLDSSWLLRYPHEFSGGQRQRICIARALALKPDVLICDESVSALDVSVQAQILNLLLDLRDEFNMSYVFISHDLAVVRFMSDRIIVMKNGEVVEFGESDQIFSNPQHEYTKSLLQSIPGQAMELF
ncbi:MAG: ABC transporter ATP-binding protein [Bdellovibrionaceae bacterium]|nr:ABC transporter ATP-binding protein [Pseudobdellovibrionaceae bacterium]